MEQKINIYEITTIHEKIIENFKPTRLYIKELAGIKYFGKTSKENIEYYSGSGKIWKDRIKKYGKENIKTLWVSDWFYDPYLIQEFALLLSKNNQIVESDSWANYIPENGLDGLVLGHKWTEEQRMAKSLSTRGENNPFYNKTHSVKTREKMSIDRTGIPKSDKFRENMLGRTQTEESNKKRSISLLGKTKGIKKGPQSEEHRAKNSAANKGHRAYNGKPTTINDITYESIQKAANAHNLTKYKLLTMINGRATAPIIINGKSYDKIVDAMRSLSLTRNQVGRLLGRKR